MAGGGLVQSYTYDLVAFSCVLRDRNVQNVQHYGGVRCVLYKRASLSDLPFFWFFGIELIYHNHGTFNFRTSVGVDQLSKQISKTGKSHSLVENCPGR